jgi:hypothetical protein
MGSKYRYIVIILLSFSAGVNGQSGLNFQLVDSTTYKYYLSGDWDKLISLGNKAVDNGIEYKYLRQRMGYAYFMSGDYVRASLNFEKALRYDSYDQFTLAYLYYTNLDLVKPETSGWFASRLSDKSLNKYLIKSSKLVEDIDAEFSVKIPSTTLRSNPIYFRLGIGSRPWARFGLYQSLSSFSQYGTVRYPTQQIEFTNRQFEYYGIVRYALLSHLIIKTGYHFLSSDYSSSVTYTNIGYFGLSADFNLFGINLDGSVSKNSTAIVSQAGLRADLRIPGNVNLKLTSGVALLNRENNTNIIFNERVGFRLNSKTWIDGDVSWGNMNYYNDFDAMYVYNSIDPITFKAGLTTYYLARERMTIWINLGADRKEYYETSLYNYNQFSFLGGIRWRL